MYDITIIGGGPGGYIAAIRASQLGLKVVCIEKRNNLGGTCLNVGCIPSKALLQSSYKFEDAQKHFNEHGITIENIVTDVQKMLQRKDKIIDDLAKGIKFLFKKNNVTFINGTAEIIKQGEILVNDTTIKTKNILIATGSVPMEIPGLKVDEKDIVTSTGALEFKSVPKHLVIIGGGVIGLELGSVWQRLGAKVTVIEYADTIAPSLDKDIIKQFSRNLKKQGFKIQTKTKVINIEKLTNNIEVKTENRNTKKEDIISCDKVLVCIGRRPFTDNLGLENINVKTTEKGAIKTDENFKTSVDNIYAFGDVIEGSMLAHKAEEEGIACVEKIANQNAHINYNNIPAVVYTHPEVASVGKTEQQCKQEGLNYITSTFPFIANSRARTSGETEGFVKIIADKDTDELLGVHIIGTEAGNLIHEVVIIMEYNGTAEDLFRCCHAHPTLNEAIKEAALGIHKLAIHI